MQHRYSAEMIILRGPGGDGKSARSHLRSNAMAGSHNYMSTSCFDIDEEFRNRVASLHIAAVSPSRSARVPFG